MHYHAAERRPLQDVVTAIRHKTTVADAGYLLAANGERHFKSPAEMVALFAGWPHAIAAAREVADACAFSLDELKYEYPQENYPNGMTPQQWLEHRVREGGKGRYPNGLSEKVAKALEYELGDHPAARPGRDCGYPGSGHPRDMRIIPPSRDFH